MSKRAENLEQALYLIRWRNRSRRGQQTVEPPLDTDRMLWLNVVSLAMADAVGEPPGLDVRGRHLLLVQAEALAWCLSPSGPKAKDRAQVCVMAGVDEIGLMSRVRGMVTELGLLDAFVEYVLRDPSHHQTMALAADLAARRHLNLLPPAADVVTRQASRSQDEDPYWARMFANALTRRRAEAGGDNVEAGQQMVSPGLVNGRSARRGRGAQAAVP